MIKYNKGSDNMMDKFTKLNTKKYKFDLKTKICIFVFIFFIGTIIGWIYEEIFYYIFEGTLEKRGFLYGPYLPVYGFGAVFICLFLKRFKKNPLIVFLLTMLITGILEYITGYILWEVYHKMWWTYEGLFLNIGNYVCLRSVLTFAVAGLALIYLIEPYILKIVNKSKKDNIYNCAIIILMIFVTDFVLTILYRNTIF